MVRAMGFVESVYDTHNAIGGVQLVAESKQPAAENLYESEVADIIYWLTVRHIRDTENHLVDFPGTNAARLPLGRSHSTAGTAVAHYGGPPPDDVSP